jgi:hypothetical protein
MMKRNGIPFILLVVLLWLAPLPLHAQDISSNGALKSGKKAFAMSLLLPGLGHQYAHDGWSRSALFFSATDVSLILGLIGANRGEGDLIQNYETLAALRAGAQIEGKSRGFFLNLGSYDSSKEYLDVLLRTRNWDRLDATQDPAFAWDWASDEDRFRYRNLRDDAETLGRRVKIFATILVANRLIAGLTAVRAVRKYNNQMLETSFYLGPPRRPGDSPMAHLTIRW